MESITVQDLNDYNIGTMTLEIARKFENFEIKVFIHTNSVLVFPFLDNLTREEVCALLVEVYNSKVLQSSYYAPQLLASHCAAALVC